jgi:two-component system OmpR family response regulator
VKPFSFAELVARIEVLLRRQERSRTTVLRVDDIVIDLIQRTVVRDGTKIELHPKEFLLLELLMKNAGKPVSKKMILSEVYGTTLKVQSNLVDVLVFRLRTKFDKPFDKNYIQTIHGLGFSFESN